MFTIPCDSRRIIDWSLSVRSRPRASSPSIGTEGVVEMERVQGRDCLRSPAFVQQLEKAKLSRVRCGQLAA